MNRISQNRFYFLIFDKFRKIKKKKFIKQMNM